MKKYLTNTNINITYISDNAAKSTAKMILLTGIKNHCANYDPFGMDTVIDCLDCPNSNFIIIDEQDNILVNFKAQEKIGKLIVNHSESEIKAYIKALSKKDRQKKNNLEYETYTIQFFENYDHDNIIEYLKNNDSNYRLIRNSDNVCMRLSKVEKRLQDDRYQRIHEETQRAMDIYKNNYEDMNNNTASSDSLHEESIILIDDEINPQCGYVKSFVRKLLKRK